MSQPIQKFTISGLKKKLFIEKEFSKTMEYFLSIAETNHYELAGEEETNDLYDFFLSVISSVVSAAQNRKGLTVKDFKCTKVDNHEFVHGGGVNHFGIVTFFYFKDLDKGMASIAQYNSSQVYFARISALASSIKSISNVPINPN
jgi:hypothetical protein